MKDARQKEESETDIFDLEASSQEPRGKSKHAGKKRSYAMKVNVGGYDLICVSTVKKIHLKLIPPHRRLHQRLHCEAGDRYHPQDCQP